MKILFIILKPISTEPVITNFSEKLQKNVIFVFQQKSDDSIFLQKTKNLANFELLMLHHLKYQIPMA